MIFYRSGRVGAHRQAPLQACHQYDMNLYRRDFSRKEQQDPSLIFHVLATARLSPRMRSGFVRICKTRQVPETAGTSGYRSQRPDPNVQRHARRRPGRQPQPQKEQLIARRERWRLSGGRHEPAAQAMGPQRAMRNEKILRSQTRAQARLFSSRVESGDPIACAPG